MEPVIAEPDGGERLAVPALGLGTWQLRGDECRQAVTHALELGYRHLDTARMYGNEAEVGDGLRDADLADEDVLVVTKVRPGDADREGVRREVAASRRELGVERLDLLLLHAPGRVPLAETMAAFRAEQEAGHVTHVGVSNVGVDELEEASAHVPIACVQNEYHPERAQDDVLAWCRQHRVAFVAYSPLHVRGRARRVLSDVAEARGRTWAQVALRWLVQQEQVAAIPRSRDARRREENLDVFAFSLDDAEMEAITAAGAG